MYASGMIKKSTRLANGYRLVYRPEHPSAMKTSNWDGYIYEHILVAENRMGRRLKGNEVVHHLNGDRADNRYSNLLVLTRSQHMKLHAWLNAGAPGIERLTENRENSVKSGIAAPAHCRICDKTVQTSDGKYCSTECAGLASRKVTRPSLEQLKSDLQTMSMVKVGKKYGVSDNAVRKWLATGQR